MSRSQGSSSIWLLLAVLVGMGYLSVSRTRHWEQIARSTEMKITAGSSNVNESFAANDSRKSTEFDHIPTPPEEPLVTSDAPPADEEPAASPATDDAVWTLATLKNAEVVTGNPLRLTSSRNAPEASQVVTPESVDEPEIDELENAEETIESALSAPIALEEPQSIDLAPNPELADSEEEPAIVSTPQPVEDVEQIEEVEDSVELLASLERRLDRLSQHPPTSQWAIDAKRELTSFQAATGAGRDPHAAMLSQLTNQAPALASALTPDAATDVRRAAHSIARRVSFWRLAEAVANVPAPDMDASRAALANALDLVERRLQESENRDGWRKYLLIDELRRAQAGDLASSESIELSAAVLARLDRPDFSEANQKFLDSPAFASLIEALRPWAAKGVEREDVLACLNQFEHSAGSANAFEIADRARRLSWSTNPEAQEAGRFLSEAYRNANLRVAVTADFLNRVIPEQPVSVGPVNDRILGVVARGRQQTQTDVSVKFTPSQHRLLASLHAEGAVTSWTRSSSGPATIRSRSNSRFVLDKPFELKVQGVRSWPASSSANSVTQLRSLETDFDAIPIVGSLIQGIVRSQYQDKQSDAKREIRRKVSRKAETEMEEETGGRIARLNKKLQNRVLTPLDELHLSPAVVETQTTEERMVMRLRVAHETQLGGNTPRPSAPADSIVSVQVHQSLINNVLSRLELDGYTFTLGELREYIAEKLNASLADESERLPESLLVTFAEEDAVSVRFEDDRVQITIAIEELRRGRDRWKNILARAYYVPEIDGLKARLKREGIINVKGDMTIRGEIAVRGIFGTIFPSERAIELTPEELKKPHLADQEVRQFTIDDGWIGFAIGPSIRDRLVRRDAKSQQ